MVAEPRRKPSVARRSMSHRTDTGLNRALRLIAIPDHRRSTRRVSPLRKAREKLTDLRFQRLAAQFTCFITDELRHFATARLSTWLACVTDLDNDDRTTFNDLLYVLVAWGDCNACNADINGDGTVDFQDMVRVLEGWGPCE